MDPIFIGYDKDFYDAIPYVRTCTEPPEPRMSCWEIEPSFESIAEKLKFARDNPKVYDEYGLPDNAEIRGFVLEHPEFLFYAPEMQRLWELIIKPFTPHMLRHTYATMLYDAGVDIKSAQKFLGHANIEMTLSVYTHLTKFKIDSAIESLNTHIAEMGYSGSTEDDD